jgi:hypothetical protein
VINSTSRCFCLLPRWRHGGRGDGVTVTVAGSAGACLANQSLAERYFGTPPGPGDVSAVS